MELSECDVDVQYLQEVRYAEVTLRECDMLSRCENYQNH